jgi:hypothetical protein
MELIKAISGYAMIKPPVIPVSTCMPPLKPANTGSPRMPSSMYARVDKKAYLGSRSIPVKKIARRERLKGIGCMGILI